MENLWSKDIVNEWMQGVLDNRGRDAEKTLKFCLEIEKYAKEENDVRLLGFAYYYSGETYYLLNDVENMFRNIANAIQLLDQSEQWELLARAYNLMAITSINKGNASAAMDYYLMGLNYCRKYGITRIESSINLNLGNLYMQNGVYHEAQHYFEQAYCYYKSPEGEERSHIGLTVVYANLARCYMLRGILEKTQEYIDKLNHECQEYYDDVDYLYVDCLKARYYHLVGNTQLRDKCIEEIEERIDRDVPIMDIFDDLYDYCELMFEIDREKAFWDMLDRLEYIVKNSDVKNLLRKVIALKLKFYRKHNDNASYLQAAGLFYELTEIMERESRSMITNMLYVRSSLERANESRRKMEALNVQLLEKSETDQLTGLANRYRLNDYSEKVVEFCCERKIPLAVEILDIDFFKQYNDNYGHQAGDECIVAIANELKKMQNNRIFCARYGGDEFIIVYAGMPLQEVRESAQELRENVMNLKREHLYSKALPIVTISQGICYGIPETENKSWDFLHAADMLLYHVKKRSRNDICIGDLHEKEIPV